MQRPDDELTCGSHSGIGNGDCAAPSPPPNQLQRFDPHSISIGSTVTIIGLRATGKSVLLADLVHNLPSKPDLTFSVATGLRDRSMDYIVSAQCGNVARQNVDDICSSVNYHCKVEAYQQQRVPHLVRIEPECGARGPSSIQGAPANVTSFFVDQTVVGLDTNAAATTFLFYSPSATTRAERHRAWMRYIPRSNAHFISFDLFNKACDAALGSFRWLVIDLSTGTMYWYRANVKYLTTPMHYLTVAESKNANNNNTVAVGQGNHSPTSGLPYDVFCALRRMFTVLEEQGPLALATDKEPALPEPVNRVTTTTTAATPQAPTLVSIDERMGQMMAQMATLMADVQQLKMRQGQKQCQ